MSENLRLDRLLVERGLAATRSRAADAIRRGAVRVSGVRVEKPGALVAPQADIAFDDPVARKLVTSNFDERQNWWGWVFAHS